MVVMDQLSGLRSRPHVVVALSSMSSSTRRPSSPPDWLISSTTSMATFACAPPIGESGPVWSAITPTLIESPMTFLLRVVLAAELRRLGPTFVPGFLKDRRDLGVGDEVLPALPTTSAPAATPPVTAADYGRSAGQSRRCWNTSP